MRTQEQLLFAAVATLSVEYITFTLAHVGMGAAALTLGLSLMIAWLCASGSKVPSSSYTLTAY